MCYSSSYHSIIKRTRSRGGGERRGRTKLDENTKRTWEESITKQDWFDAHQ